MKAFNAPAFRSVDALCAEKVRLLHVNADIWVSDSIEDRHEASKICRRCPVANECFSFAISQPFGSVRGVYGGTDFGYPGSSRRKSLLKKVLESREAAI